MLAAPQVVGEAPQVHPLQAPPVRPVRTVVAATLSKVTGQATLLATVTPGAAAASVVRSMGTHWAMAGTQSGSSQSARLSQSSSTPLKQSSGTGVQLGPRSGGGG